MFTKSDKAYWVSGILVILVIGFLVFQKIQNNKPATTWVKGEIYKFCVSEICLENKIGRWWWSEKNIQNPAEENIVNKFVKDLSELTLIDVVSNNPERFADLGIATSSAKIMVNGQELVLGNLGDDLESTYVKPGDENKVYLIKSVWGTKDLVKPEYWKIRFINNISVFQIKEINLKYGAHVIKISPENGAWKEKDLVNKLAYLETTGYVGTILDNWQPLVSVEIKSENETSNYEVGIGIKNKQVIYVAKVKGEFWQLDKGLFDLLTSVPKTN